MQKKVIVFLTNFENSQLKFPGEQLKLNFVFTVF